MRYNLVNLWYQTPNCLYNFKGRIPETIVNGKAVCFPLSIFKQAFGFDLPPQSIITQE
ncbi:hypothetical protein [Mucilaginibacter gracilis]|uniref:hypothetical protein n=1 Tax=Mucilaginibacter gracilis TaxID=423350 RepID=UPI0013C36E83|nr:hypothetical protein [Mucilaginibacter gracilis]